MTPVDKVFIERYNELEKLYYTFRGSDKNSKDYLNDLYLYAKEREDSVISKYRDGSKWSLEGFIFHYLYTTMKFQVAYHETTSRKTNPHWKYIDNEPLEEWMLPEVNDEITWDYNTYLKKYHTDSEIDKILHYTKEFEKLDNYDKIVIDLYIYGDKNIRDVSKFLSVSTTTANKYVKKIIEKIKNNYGNI